MIDLAPFVVCAIASLRIAVFLTLISLVYRLTEKWPMVVVLLYLPLQACIFSPFPETFLRAQGFL